MTTRRMTFLRATLILASLGNMTLSAQPGPPFTQFALVTSSTQVDGTPLRVRRSVSKSTDASLPIVVFESGAGMPLETWEPILDKVAAFAHVVAYDRSGTGQSPWDGQPPTPQRVNRRLKTLLDSLGVTSPIVLVGHSWGGALARYFIAEYPHMVKAILYLDPTDVTMTQPMWQQMFASFGATAKDLDAFFALMDSSTTNVPPGVRAESLAILDLMRAPTLEARNLKPAPNVPSSVLLAGRVAALPKGMVAFDGEAYASALQTARVAGLRAWANDRGGTW